MKHFRLAGVLLLGLLAVWLLPVGIALTKPLLPPDQSVPIAQASSDSFTYANLGISAPITVMKKTNPAIASNWSVLRQSLYQGVDLALSNQTIADSQIVYVIGHSSDYLPHRYSAVFAGLYRANVGDSINLTLGQTQYQYQVVSKEVMAPEKVASYVARAPLGQSKLAVVTCWPVFTTTNRLVILAKLQTN